MWPIGERLDTYYDRPTWIGCSADETKIPGDGQYIHNMSFLSGQFAAPILEAMGRIDPLSH